MKKIQHLLLALASVPVTASAASNFDGASFELGYGLVNKTSWDLAFTPGAYPELLGVTGSASLVEVANFAELGWQVDFSGNTATFKYIGTDEWMNYGTPKFQGLRIHDVNGVLPDIQSVSVTTPLVTAGAKEGASGYLIEGFNKSSDVRFDANSIYLNLTNSMWHAHDMGSMGCPSCDTISLQVTFAAAPVPEASTALMLALGLGVVGSMGRRRQQAA